MLRRETSSWSRLGRGFVRGALALVLLAATNASAENYDPICSKYVESRGFQKFYPTRNGERKAGDTIYWETKVLPDFERIAKDPKFQSEANLNAQFKLTLASYGIRENEIASANQDRLISDCRRQPELEGCLAMQTYCVRDYIQKEWPKAVENFNQCFDKTNREHGCGTDFQTADGIAKNIAVLQKFQSKVGAINDDLLKLPNVPDYLSDITSSFRNFSAKVQDLLAKGKSKIEDLKKQEVAAADKRYRSTVAMQNNLGQACRAFDECKGYLDRKGYADNKQLLNQISSCQVKNEATPESGQRFDETMKVMKDVHSVAQKTALAELVKETFDESLGQTARQYLEGYFAINGRLPTESAFKSAVGGRFPSDVLKTIYEEAKANASNFKKMDVGAEMTAFNTQVKALNAACAAAKASGGGGESNPGDAAAQNRLAAVGDAYNGLLYGSRFGPLLALKRFSEKVGAFDSEACFSKGEGMRELAPSNQGRVTEALNDALDVIGDKGRELVRNEKDLTDPDDPGSGLRFFLENDPLVLRELIRKTNSAEQAMLLCGSIEKIYAKEARRKTWSKVLTGLAIAGAVVATVMSAGAAAPGLVALVSASSIGIGTMNGLINIDYAMSTKTHMQQSGITGTFDRDVSNNLIAQSRAEIKGEAVGIGLQFVPVVGKSVAGVTSKTVIQPLMRTSLMKAVAETGAWKVGAATVNGSTKAVSAFMNSLNKGTATFGELSGALLSRASPGTGKLWAATFNAISKDMSQDMAMIFTATALTHPDPFSEDGMLQMLEGFVQSRGIAALGASGGEIYRRLKAGGGMKSLFANKLVAAPPTELQTARATKRGWNAEEYAERSWMAKEVLGSGHGPITAKEEVAIFEAHMVGDGVHGYGTYTKTELLQKRRILAAAGFADHEIEALLRSGVCGAPSPALGRSSNEEPSPVLLSTEQFDRIRSDYPESVYKVQEWKTRTRQELKRDFMSKGMKEADADLAARSAVNKLEREVVKKNGEDVTTVSSGTVYESLRDGSADYFSTNKSIQLEPSAVQYIKKIDASVTKKLAGWVENLQKFGMDEVRKRPGYHDHPLRGNRAGERSVYLTGSWRVIYVELPGGKILIKEVTNHDYRTN